jgi:hypothetical protein
VQGIERIRRSVLVLVEEEILLRRIIRPDILDALEDLLVILDRLRFSTTSSGAPVRMAKSISSSFVRGHGASSRYEASSSVQYMCDRVGVCD